MQVPGHFVFNLYQELEKVKASLAGAVARSDGAAAAVKAAIEKAEHDLRERVVEAQAAELQEASSSTVREAWPTRQSQSQPLAPRQAKPREKGMPPAPIENDSALLRRDPHKFLTKKSGKEVMKAPKRPGRCGGSAGSGKRRREKTSIPNRLLPRQNRLDPLADPPPLIEDDLDNGLYNLSTRGFIPHMADLTPAIERGIPAVSQCPPPACPKGTKQSVWAAAPPGCLALVRYEQVEPEPGTPISSPETSLALVPVPPRTGNEPPDVGQASRLGTPPRRNRKGDPLPPIKEGRLALPASASAEEEGIGSSTFYTELVDGSNADATVKFPELPAPPSMINLRSRSSMFMMTRADPRALKQRQEDAATFISSAWKGSKCRKERKAQMEAAARIQRAWASARAHDNFHKVIEATKQAEQEMQAMMVKELGSDWSERKKQRRLVEIHLCSIYIPPHRRACRQNLQAMQAAQLGRIFRVLDPQVDVVFVVPRRMHDEILEYYSAIMQFRGIRNPPGRLQIIVPDAGGTLPENLSLTQALLSSPKAMLKLKQLIAGQQAYVVPGAALRPETMLAAQLKIPLMGLPVGDGVVPHSKSTACRLVTLAGLPTGPSAGNLFTEDELYNSLTTLIVQHPEVNCWLMKLDDEREARGHAYLHVAQLRRLMDIAPKTSSSEQDEAPASLDPAVVQKTLRQHLEKKLVFCNRRAYADLREWLVEASQSGAMIQAVPDKVVATTSVHIQIEPDQSVTILGTSEVIHSQPFVTTASWYPATKGSWLVLQEVGQRMGNVLAGRGVLGFASIDVVFFKNRHRVSDSQGFDRESRGTFSSDQDEECGALQMLPTDSAVDTKSRLACWVVSVDSQLTDAASSLFPVQFLSQTKLDQATGHLHMPDSVAALIPQPGSHEQHVDAEQQPLLPPPNTQRWALVSNSAHVEGLSLLSHAEVFKRAKARNVSYDLTHNVGCMFALIDIMYSFVSLIAVDETQEGCARRLTSAVAAMSEVGQQTLQPAQVPNPLLGLGPPVGSSMSMSGYGKPLVEVSMPRDVPLPASAGEDGPPSRAPDYLTCTEVQTALRGWLIQHHDKHLHHHHRNVGFADGAFADASSEV
mmetsp:Transcript_25501/g.55857  ORF Transcript_25501/g.55857 Transcript_25501/m.55857 type:complete len:1098 (-) Transcript_25501:29-3322(-)